MDASSSFNLSSCRPMWYSTRLQPLNVAQMKCGVYGKSTERYPATSYLDICHANFSLNFFPGSLTLGLILPITFPRMSAPTPRQSPQSIDHPRKSLPSTNVTVYIADPYFTSYLLRRDHPLATQRQQKKHDKKCCISQYVLLVGGVFGRYPVL